MNSEDRSSPSRVVVLGAGPSGLAAAHELAQAGRSVVVLEKQSQVGGLAATLNYGGYRFDIGGHRFFTKNAEVSSLWREMLGQEFTRVRRLSRIYYRGRFFHYPLRPLSALRGLGPLNAVAVLASYARQRIHPYPREETLEQWVSNQFGKRLYRIFFKTYTEKVWGVPCSQISAQWAAQRIKNLSVASLVSHMLFGFNGKAKAKSLIEWFDYPRLGPGQLYEFFQARLERLGQAVHLNSPVRRIEHDGRGRVTAAVAETPEGLRRFEASAILSSIPINELILQLDPPAPAPVQEAARQLRYRDFLVVNLIVERDSVFPDHWLYIHDPNVQAARVQNYKNWSPAMVADPRKTSLGMEYFCNRDGELWNCKDEALIALAGREAEQLGLGQASQVIDGFVARRENAYCLHDTSYQPNLERVRGYLAGFSNLQTMGRAGMFKYNNQDHAIVTGLLAARNALGGNHDPWAVNVDAEYQEEERL